MAFIPTAATVRVDVLQDLSGQHCENTLWYFSAGGSLDVTEMGALGSTINNIFATSFAPLHTSEWVLRGCVVTDQSSESAPAVNVATTPTPGTFSDNGLPNNVAWCVKFLTAGRGRASRGRNYVMNIPKSLVSENVLDADYAADVITAYNRLLIPDLGIDASLVVVSHRLNNVPRSAGLAQPVTLITFSDLFVDSQRRRLPGRGN